MIDVDAAKATSRRRSLGQLVLPLSARRPVLASAFDTKGIVTPSGGHGFDESGLLSSGETPPSGRSEPCERTVADLVLHALRPLDPIAEIHVRQPCIRRASDMIENDVVPKPGSRLMFRVVEAVNHRQPVPLPIRQAGTDQAALPPVR